MPASRAARMTVRTDEVGLSSMSAMRRVASSGGHAPGLAAVGARVGVQRLEAAIAVELAPVADGVGGNSGAGGAGDGLGLGGLVAHPGDEARGAHGQMH